MKKNGSCKSIVPKLVTVYNKCLSIGVTGFMDKHQIQTLTQGEHHAGFENTAP
jgi:hypothetical protein